MRFLEILLGCLGRRLHSMCSERMFPMPDLFDTQACGHCVPLFLIESGVPTEKQLNGTLTLLSLGGQVFGVTAQHVIAAALSTDTELPTVHGRVQRFPIH